MTDEIDHLCWGIRSGTQICERLKSPYQNSDNWFLFNPPIYLVFTKDKWYVKSSDVCKWSSSFLYYVRENKNLTDTIFINSRLFISISNVIDIYRNIGQDKYTKHSDWSDKISVFQKLESDLPRVAPTDSLVGTPITIESIKFPLSITQSNQPVTQPQPTKENSMATIKETMRPMAEKVSYTFQLLGGRKHIINLLSFSRNQQDTFVKLRDISTLLSPSQKKIGIRERRAKELGVKLFNGIAYLPLNKLNDYLNGMRYCKNNPQTKELWSHCAQTLQRELSDIAAFSPYRTPVQIVDKVKKKPTYKNNQNCPIVNQVNPQDTGKQIVYVGKTNGVSYQPAQANPQNIGRQTVQSAQKDFCIDSSNGVSYQPAQITNNDLGDTQSSSLKVRNWIQILDINRRQLELQKQQSKVLDDLRNLGNRQQELIEQVHRLTEDAMQQGIELRQFDLKINEILQSYGVSELAAVHSGMTNAEAWKHYTALVSSFGKVTGAPYNEVHHYCRHIASNRLGIDIEQELESLRKKSPHATAEPILRAHNVTVRYYLMAHWALIIEGGKNFWEWLNRKENAKTTQETKAATQGLSLNPSQVMTQVKNFLHS